MERVSRLDPRPVWDEISVVLMNDRGIARLNKCCLGELQPTDVLSFRYALPFRSGCVVIGEVIVNVERAILEGARRRGASSELALYLAHGCDHLAGSDDADAVARRRMRSREMRWLRQIGRALDISRLLSVKHQ